MAAASPLWRMLVGSATSADSRLSTKLASTSHPPRLFVVEPLDVPAEVRNLVQRRSSALHMPTRNALALLPAPWRGHSHSPASTQPKRRQDMRNDSRKTRTLLNA